MQHAFDIFVNIRDGMATEAVVSPAGSDPGPQSKVAFCKLEGGCFVK